MLEMTEYVKSLKKAGNVFFLKTNTAKSSAAFCVYGEHYSAMHYYFLNERLILLDAKKEIPSSIQERVGNL